MLAYMLRGCCKRSVERIILCSFEKYKAQYDAEITWIEFSKTGGEMHGTD